jgi:hypothetical protein
MIIVLFSWKCGSNRRWEIEGGGEKGERKGGEMWIHEKRKREWKKRRERERIRGERDRLS